MAKQWFAGVVKEVQSGDCVVVAGAGRLPNGQCPEKRLNLASLSAPRLPRRDGSTISEEFAWESREFLRQLAIGQKCVFRVDYRVDAIDREFGTVLIANKVNIGLEVVRNGWAKIRDSNDAKTPEFEALQDAANAAEAAAIGIYQTDPEARERATFKFDTSAAADAAAFVQAQGKGRPVPAIVDQVLTGSTYKIVTLEERAVFTLNLCGAQCAQVRRNANGDLEAEPHGMAAKVEAELKVLNREVRVMLYQGEDNRVLGSLIYEDDNKACSMSDTLVAKGLAKYVDWSARMLPSGAPELKAKELAAKEAKLNMWSDYVAPIRNTAPIGKHFKGKVIEVSSGDTLYVKDPQGVEHRMSLASIRAPRLRPAGAASDPEPYAQDARDFLRKYFIGQDVDVRIEYSRKIQPTNADAPTDNLVIQFGNVALPAGPQEAAEMVVRRGFAVTQTGKEGEERSSIMAQLLEAEEYARGKRSGMHSGKNPGRVRVNDVSVPGSANRAKQYLPFFQRQHDVPALVEHVMSGSRFKVHVAKEGVTVAFSPSGVKTPSRGMPARGNAPGQPAEPFGAEAYAFAREMLMQRDVTISTESVDKNGNFLGRIMVGKVDYSMALLSAGLGCLHPSFNPDRVSGAAQLVAAQDAAKAARKGMWHDYVESDEADVEPEQQARAMNGGSAPCKPVIITHVSHGQCLHMQTDLPRVEWVTKEAASAAAAPFDGHSAPIKEGAKVLAQFSGDKLWYRGYVEKVHNALSTAESFTIYFIDFGNSERMDGSRLRPMSAALAAVAPLAQSAKLAYLTVPELGAEFGYEAAETLASLLGIGSQLMCQAVAVQRAASSHPRDAAGFAHVVLYNPGSEARGDLTESINAAMLETGFARLPSIRTIRTPEGKSAVSALSDAEDRARKGHLGIFRYGDPGDSDDDDDYPAMGGRRRR